MTDSETDLEELDVEPDRLIEQNGLSQLFANRVRAKFVVALFYDQPLTIAEIADAAGVTQTVTHQAREQLEKFDILESVERADTDVPAYRLQKDDPLVEMLEDVAELATERYYDE